MKLALAALLLVIACIVGVVVLSADDAPTPAPPPTDTPAEEDIETGEMTVADQRRHMMQGLYPFEEFLPDIEELRRPPDPNSPNSTQAVQAKISKAMYDDLKFTIRRENVSFAEVIELMRPQIEGAGIELHTLDGPLPEERFDLFLTDKSGWEVISELERLSNFDPTNSNPSNPGISYTMTLEGLCIGKWETLYKFKARSRGEHNRRESERHAANILLDGKVKPEFVDAHVGDVVAQLTAQCGVPIIVDRETWGRRKLLTWRATERPLREVLRKICHHLQCGFRVKDGRVFLIAD